MHTVWTPGPASQLDSVDQTCDSPLPYDQNIQMIGLADGDLPVFQPANWQTNKQPNAAGRLG
jgi:hypothetical protein